ncbi:hypothetical protein A0127_08695 [Thermococcus peptonophilus]|uniref:Helix-turn-helix type 11 domain-containing protein n=2 Tax=Thermococcus peptonophilus TaxID=53952 RepID=A0A142CWT3_9EURY|nr:hypothetical protein A0127_08695 [Thermococcus peptonophilus]
MRLLNFQHESANVEDCTSTVVELSNKALKSTHGFISSAKISLSFGAFMNLRVTVLIDDEKDMLKGIIAEHSTGKNRADALNKALELLNSKLPKNAEVVDFEVGTYVTPVTRRAYGVAVAVYNVPIGRKNFSEFTTGERRHLLERVLREFNYNPKVLNISELARMFGVSRDSIYYDIQQILKEK